MSGTRRISKPQIMSISVNDIHYIKEILEEMSGKVSTMEVSLDKLNQTVIGNESYDQEGLVKKVKRHDEYIEKDKEYKNKILGGSIIIAFLYGIFLKFSDRLF